MVTQALMGALALGLGLSLTSSSPTPTVTAQPHGTHQAVTAALLG